MSTGNNETKPAIFSESNDTSFLIYSTDQVLKHLQSSSFKEAAILSELYLSLYNYKKLPEDRLHFRILEDKAISYNMAVNLPDHKNFWYSTLKLKIKQLIEGGFFDHWMDHYKNHRSIVVKEEEETKVVLTWDHLYVGFTISFTMLLLSAVVFTMEGIKFYILNYFRALLLKI